MKDEKAELDISFAIKIFISLFCMLDIKKPNNIKIGVATGNIAQTDIDAAVRLKFSNVECRLFNAIFFSRELEAD